LNNREINMFIPGALIAIILMGIAYYLGRKDSSVAAYWTGRAEGWKACENMVTERAKESGIKDRDGKIMTEKEIWEAFLQ
jgi:hypothetical protein